jgi:WD40 repeat protein
MAAIRQLASSYDGHVLAAADSESVVHLWDLQSFTCLNTIETTLDFGGSRLAIAPDGHVVAAGAYHVHGIAAYRASDGTELWRRKDLKKVQHLRFGYDAHRIFCCFDRSACESLDAASGKSGRTLRGISDLWESPFRPVRLMKRSRDFVIATDKSKIAIVPKVTFAALSAAFSESAVGISEAGGPVRLFDLSSGKQLWRHDPPKGTHFVRLAFSAAIGHFVGLLWPFERGGASSLHVFDEKSGVAHWAADVGPSTKAVFCQRGTRLVNSSGDVFSVPSGRVECRLAFRVTPAGTPLRQSTCSGSPFGTGD